tara:strand:+ start:1259 stop:1735 length:477 start_codon:yes stop_codon:yes gene_type:complete
MERRRLLPEEFLNYITEPISSDEMSLWVKVNNINVEKSELFCDYLDSLYGVILDTYLGEDIIKSETEKKGHFNWCWDKTINNFKKENIVFRKEGKHYVYLWNFFDESFYQHTNNEEHIRKLRSFLGALFTLYINKTKSELDMFGEIYKILDDSLTVDK